MITKWMNRQILLTTLPVLVIVLAFWNCKGPKANFSGKVVKPLPEGLEDVVINNRVRKEITTAIAALKLASPDKALRLAAARELQSNAEESMLPALSRAFAKESDPDIKNLLALTQASIQLSTGDKSVRIAAITALAASNSPSKIPPAIFARRPAK